MLCLKRFLKIITSRSFLFSVLALIQIGLFFFLIWQFSNIGPYTYAMMIILSVLVLVFVFEKDDLNPSYKVMWIIITVLLPITGAVMYLLWGGQKLRPKIAKRFSQIERQADSSMIPQPLLLEVLDKVDPTLSRQAEYLYSRAAAPLYSETECRYFKSGEDFFETFLPELEQAQHCIFMEYFIIEPGIMWDRTLAVLRRKAAEGVDVRIVWDGFGSLFTLPEGYEQTLRSYGIEAGIFNPIRVTAHISQYIFLNHRDHRKICVIDGEVGFTGGLNFADEYINRKERFGYWKDTAFMLRGPAVYSLTATFLKIWSFVDNSTPNYASYLPTRHYVTDGFVQPYADTPLDNENVSACAYLNIINRAQRYVYIATPYLVIDYELQSALSLAAKSGVDVRIITPGIPDKPYVYVLTRSYYRQLLQAGVRIFEYTPGFLHAKMYVSDDSVAVVGSANMDFRSLYLHFENCCAFYGGAIINDVRNDILHCCDVGREITLDEVKALPWYRRLLQIVFRFFAPFM
ncbi:MAG: cardiolipin synthase [Pygmaiobacter sp.]|nr:cardiolipin synthase [Pygmaiobacter sp.]